MRKLILTLMSVMLVLGTLTANPVTPQTAQTVALNFFIANAGSNVNTNSLSANLVYSSTEFNGTVDYYIYNMSPAKGFVIVTGDDNLDPVIGYSYESNFVLDTKSHTGVSDWMGTAAQKISAALSQNVQADDNITKLWATYQQGNKLIPVRATSVGPLVTTTWNQEPLYNIFCPYNTSQNEQCVTGCVATAMAQIIKYWNYPAHGTGSYSYTSGSYGVQSANFGATTYQWTKMPAAVTSTTDTAVAILMYQCGVSVAMSYGDDAQGGSGAWVFQSEAGTGNPCAQNSYASYFGYVASSMQGLHASSYTSAAWITVLQGELNAGRPVEYEGWATQGGHTWVCDGYNASNQFHMNWGWGGVDNGYYSLSDLNPSPYVFSSNDGALIGIEPATTSCGVPAGLGTSSLTSSSVTLGWTAVTGASSYNVQYKLSTSSTWTTTSVSTNSLSLSGLAAGSTYNYEVQTVCSVGGSSAYSAASNFTTPAPPCSVASGLTTSNLNSSSVTLNWGAVSGAVSYNVQYEIIGAANWTTGSSSTNSLSISGLTASSNYQFEVETVCSANSAAYSVAADFSTPAPPCSVASGLTTSNLTSSSVTLNWGAVSGAVSYNVQYQIIGVTSWTTGSSSTNSLSISGLTASSNYQFEVETVCSSNSATYSAATDFSTPAPPCSVASGLTTSNLTSSSVTLNWGAVSGAVSYNVQYQIIGAANWTTGSSSINSLSVTGLTASSNYQFEVQTVCSGSSVAFSTAADFSTPAPPCSVASGLSTSNLTSSSVTLNWGAVSGAVSYNVQYQIIGATNWTTGSSSTNSLNISSLTVSSNYQFEVETVCSSNSATYSAAADFSTPAAPCSVASGLTTSNLTSSSVTLNWGAVSGAVSYNVQYQIIGVTNWTTGSSSTNSLSITGLTASNNYQFEVQTVCAANSATFSAAADFTTPAPPCSVASGLSTSNLTSTSITLNWGAVSGAVSYNVQYQIIGATSWTTASSGTNSLSVTGLTASSKYQFEVQTVCSANSATFSAAADFSTPAPSCSVPSGLGSSNLTTTSATISWGAVSGAVSYNVQYKVSSASTWTTISGVTSTSVSLTGLTAATTYNFEVETVCSGSSSAYSAASSFSTTSGTVTYCTDKGNSQAFEYIKNVTFGSFSNTTTTITGYGNFTSSTINLTSSGTATTFTLTPGYTGAAYNEYFVIYIDYNGNGEFTDAGEKVYTSGAARATISGSFTVPSGLNITTRMRIIMQYGSAATSSCGTFAYGEIEDYTVNISPTNTTSSPTLNNSPAENNIFADADNNSTSSIYPNPTSQMVNIILSPIENIQPKIEIISVTGQTLISYFAGEMEQETRVDVSSLPAGIYLVRTTYGSDRVSTEKLSKIN